MAGSRRSPRPGGSRRGGWCPGPPAAWLATPPPPGASARTTPPPSTQAAPPPASRSVAAGQGPHRSGNPNRAGGVRLASVRRGVAPRRFALFAFGGAAGLHATDIARQLQLSEIIVPRVAAVLSAWGMLATDLRFDVSRSHIGDTSALDGGAVRALFEEMEAEGLARLRASFAGPSRATRTADMRYGEQVFEIAVPLD